jgi:hypothetical protein
MAASLRWIALVLALLLAGLWLAPALLLPRLAARLLTADGVGLEFEGVRPALPWGMTAQRLLVVRGDGKLEVSGVSARIGRSGARVEGSVGAGTLLLRASGLTLRGGAVVRAQSLPLEALAGVLPGAVALRGIADGVYRFGERDSLEATVSRGAVSLRGPVMLEIPFAQLVVAARREDDGAWRVDFADLRGPPLSGTANGRVGADGRLALHVQISQLEQPALSAFSMAALPTGPLPLEVELGGTLEQPMLTPIGASAR